MRWNKESCFTGLKKREHYILVCTYVAKHLALQINIQEALMPWKQLATIALTVVAAVHEEQTKKK